MTHRFWGSSIFGAQGLTFSIFKLYTTEPRIVETLSHEISYFGGIKLTHLLVDYIVSHLIKEKGMDISRDSFLMNKLKLLCN
jgi:molecular chaperone DnaK (HSP70)